MLDPPRTCERTRICWRRLVRKDCVIVSGLAGFRQGQTINSHWFNKRSRRCAVPQDDTMERIWILVQIRVSHDNPRAQTCTTEGPGLQKHNQNSTGRHPKREEKNEFCGGRGKQKKSEILGGPGEGRSRGRAVRVKSGRGPGAPNMTKPKP